MKLHEFFESLSEADQADILEAARFALTCDDEKLIRELGDTRAGKILEHIQGFTGQPPENPTKKYAQVFTRTNFSFEPPLREQVVVIMITNLAPGDIEFEHKAWEALWVQYPTWKCPYHQGNPPPNEFETIRHGFSSASQGALTLLHPAQKK